MSLAFPSNEVFDKLIEDKSYSFIQKGMLVFDTAQFDGILKKISEFNSTMLSDPVKCLLSVFFNFGYLVILVIMIFVK